MKIKTGELVGAALDWAVAKCEGGGAAYVSTHSRGRVLVLSDDIHPWGPGDTWSPSTDWAQGGPIIERECMDILCLAGGDDGWQADKYLHIEKVEAFGPTPLVAAMRCFVASRLGDEVDIPEELAEV